MITKLNRSVQLFSTYTLKIKLIISIFTYTPFSIHLQSKHSFLYIKTISNKIPF